MSTQLSYNGVNFGYLKTHSLEQIPKFDPSDTDQIYTRMILTVESLLYLSADLNTFVASAAQQGGTAQPSDMGSRIALLTQQLEHPRKPLSFLYNGVSLLSSDGTDEANGPKVLFCRIKDITSQAVRIEWAVEVAVNLCSGNTVLKGISGNTQAGAGQSAIASLRWDTTQDIDDGGYSTITTTGMLIGRRNILQALGQPIDSLRQYIKPPLINGFTRTGQYTIQSDGLAIKFVLKDTQKLQQPSNPFVKISGTFTRSCSNGAKWFAEVSLRATYRYDHDRLNAVGLALDIAMKRLLAGDPIKQANGAPIVREGVIREHMYDPIVEVMLKAQANPPGGTTVTTTPGWWARNAKGIVNTLFPPLIGVTAIGGAVAGGGKTETGGAIAAGAAIVTAAGAAVGSGSINLTATADMGFGFDPMYTTQDPLNLVAATGAGLMLNGFVVLAQQLRDECTATSAQQAIAQQTLKFSGVPGTAEGEIGDGDFSGNAGSGGSFDSGVAQPIGNSGFTGGGGTFNVGATGNAPSADPTAQDYANTVATPGVPSAAFPSADPTFAGLIGSLANVFIANIVTATDAGSPYVGNSTPGVWTEYACDYTYRDHDGNDPSKNNGYVVARSAVAGIAPVVCQISQTVYYLDCYYQAERIGGPPEVPAAQSYAEWTLLNYAATKPNLDISGDGVTLVYKAEGRIKWVWVGVDPKTGLYGPPSLDYPAPPWLNLDYSKLPDWVDDVDPNLQSET